MSNTDVIVCSIPHKEKPDVYTFSNVCAGQRAIVRKSPPMLISGCCPLAVMNGQTIRSIFFWPSEWWMAVAEMDRTQGLWIPETTTPTGEVGVA